MASPDSDVLRQFVETQVRKRAWKLRRMNRLPQGWVSYDQVVCILELKFGVKRVAVCDGRLINEELRGNCTVVGVEVDTLSNTGLMRADDPLKHKPATAGWI